MVTKFFFLSIILCFFLSSCEKVMETCQTCYLIRHTHYPIGTYCPYANTDPYGGHYITDTVNDWESSFPLKFHRRNKCSEEADTLNAHETDPNISYGCSCEKYPCEAQ